MSQIPSITQKELKWEINHLQKNVLPNRIGKHRIPVENRIKIIKQELLDMESGLVNSELIVDDPECKIYLGTKPSHRTIELDTFDIDTHIRDFDFSKMAQDGLDEIIDSDNNDYRDRFNRFIEPRVDVDYPLMGI